MVYRGVFVAAFDGLGIVRTLVEVGIETEDYTHTKIAEENGQGADLKEIVPFVESPA
jgi:hypothetical protein